jgi:hypothetical protein
MAVPGVENKCLDPIAGRFRLPRTMRGGSSGIRLHHFCAGHREVRIRTGARERGCNQQRDAPVQARKSPPPADDARNGPRPPALR